MGQSNPSSTVLPSTIKIISPKRDIWFWQPITSMSQAGTKQTEVNTLHNTFSRPPLNWVNPYQAKNTLNQNLQGSQNRELTKQTQKSLRDSKSETPIQQEVGQEIEMPRLRSEVVLPSGQLLKISFRNNYWNIFPWGYCALGGMIFPSGQLLKISVRNNYWNIFPWGSCTLGGMIFKRNPVAFECFWIYIYIYTPTYICCRVKNWSKLWGF